MFGFECNALGAKHNHYFNYLVAAEWEATNTLILLTVSVYEEFPER